MKLKKKPTFIFALIILCISHSFTLARNTYLGQKISVSTIASLIQPLPEDATPVIDWIDEHVKELRYLAATPQPLSTWGDKKYYGKQTLLECGLVSRGSNNFVFKVPGTDWWIKISGPLRRLINIYVYNTDRNPFAKSEYALHKEFSNSKFLNSFTVVPTFQTISRFANSLLCQDVLITNDIDQVYFPDIYLVHIPGNPTDISDDNYIIVEREVPNIENIYLNNRSSDGLTKQGIKQLYKVITQGGIFDFNGENLRIDDQDNLVFIDLEQGIVENPIDFFNKNKDIFDHRVFSGIKSFTEMHLIKDSTEYNYVRSLVLKDKALQESAYWDRYKKLFKVRGRRLTRSADRKRKLRLGSLAQSLIKYPVTNDTLKKIKTKK